MNDLAAVVERLRDFCIRNIDRKNGPGVYCRSCGGSWDATDPEQHVGDCLASLNEPPKEMHGENVGIGGSSPTPRPLGTRTEKSETVESGATDVTAGRDRQIPAVAALIERLRVPKSSLPFGDTRDKEAAEAADALARLAAPVPDKEK